MVCWIPQSLLKHKRLPDRTAFLHLITENYCAGVAVASITAEVEVAGTVIVGVTIFALMIKICPAKIALASSISFSSRMDSTVVLNLEAIRSILSPTLIVYSIFVPGTKSVGQRRLGRQLLVLGRDQNLVTRIDRTCPAEIVQCQQHIDIHFKLLGNTPAVIILLHGVLKWPRRSRASQLAQVSMLLSGSM